MAEVINVVTELLKEFGKTDGLFIADKDVCNSSTKEANMRRIRRLAAAAFIILTLLVLTTLVTLTAAAQDPNTGQTLWAEGSCQNCHGESGEGVWAGPLAGTDKTAQDWITQVRAPRNRMPTFSEAQISDQAIIDMHAYLASLEAPAGFEPAQADLPADAPAGQVLLVEKKCVGCHGITGPIRGFQSRGETPTVERVIAQLRTPWENMPMFDATQVSDEEAATITAFLVSQVNPSSLPETGGVGIPVWMVALLALGSGLMLSGLVLGALRTRSLRTQ
jgi:mono/diheme cytochrome c family protein